MRLKAGYWLAMAATILFATQSASAQSVGLYELSWSGISLISSASGEAYTLDLSVGQPDAGEVSGGEYAIEAGFFTRPSVPVSLQLLQVYVAVLQR